MLLAIITAARSLRNARKMAHGSRLEEGNDFAPVGLCILQAIKAESQEAAGREATPQQGRLQVEPPFVGNLSALAEISDHQEEKTM